LEKILVLVLVILENEEMAKYGDVLIAFFDSESTGTK
jgi:hypothetical protein